MENSSPNPSFSICDIRIQKQMSRSFGKSFPPQKIVLPKLRPHCSATCLNTWRAGHHRKILFSSGEKEIRRAQNEKSKEYFSVVRRACRAVAGLASLVGVLLKESSNFVQKTPVREKLKQFLVLMRKPKRTFCSRNGFPKRPPLVH